MPQVFGGKAAREYPRFKMGSVVGELAAGVNDPSRSISYTLTVPEKIKTAFAEYSFVPDAFIAIDTECESDTWGGKGDAGILVRSPLGDKS